MVVNYSQKENEMDKENEITHEEISEMTSLVHSLINRSKMQDPWFMKYPQAQKLRGLVHEFDIRIQRQKISKVK